MQVQKAQIKAGAEVVVEVAVDLEVDLDQDQGKQRNLIIVSIFILISNISDPDLAQIVRDLVLEAIQIVLEVAHVIQEVALTVLNVLEVLHQHQENQEVLHQRQENQEVLHQFQNVQEVDLKTQMLLLALLISEKERFYQIQTLMEDQSKVK